MQETIVIGHIGLIQRSKRQDFVLEVICELKKQELDVIGLFAGEVREKEYEKELKMQAGRLGISDCVLFLGRRDDIPDILKMIDVLIIPSSFEGFPLAGLEASAAGVPIAACNAAGAEEFIRVSGGGKSFCEYNVKEAADTVIEVINDRKCLVKSSKDFVISMTNDKYKVKISNLFEENRL